jgi:DNA-binding NtrC family response regulator
VPPAQCSILVLEDEPAVLRLITATLELAGLENVCATCSIAEARQKWHSRDGVFDLFITDFSLPDGSACSFIEELLTEKPALPVLLTTGYSEDMLGLGAISAQVTLLQKPFRPSELKQLILRLLSGIERN